MKTENSAQPSLLNIKTAATNRPKPLPADFITEKFCKEKDMKLKYSTLLFDLDGTLTDSGEGIIKSAQYALEHFGIIENDMDKLNTFIGPPL